MLTLANSSVFFSSSIDIVIPNIKLEAISDDEDVSRESYNKGNDRNVLNGHCDVPCACRVFVLY